MCHCRSIRRQASTFHDRPREIIVQGLVDRQAIVELPNSSRSKFGFVVVPFKLTLRKCPIFSNIDISSFTKQIDLKFLENIYMTDIKLFYYFWVFEIPW